MMKHLLIAACAAAMCVSSVNASTLHTRASTMPSKADKTLTFNVMNHTTGIDTGYCIKRAPKTKTHGGAGLLFCYGDPDVAYDFYIDNSGPNLDPDYAGSTVYIQNVADGSVNYAR